MTLPAGDILEDGAAVERAWWRARIRFAWPEDEDPRWLWLELIHQSAGDASLPTESTEALLAYYRNLDLRIHEIWQDEAQHAFLHHPNALFGYQPLMIRKLMRF